MTANGVIKNALDRLGYSDSNGNSQLTQRVMARTLSLFTGEYYEVLRLLNREILPLPSFDTEIDLTPSALEVLINGVATAMAQSESDDFNYNLFSLKYESSKKALNHFEDIKDVLPNYTEE